MPLVILSSDINHKVTLNPSADKSEKMMANIQLAGPSLAANPGRDAEQGTPSTATDYSAFVDDLRYKILVPMFSISSLAGIITGYQLGGVFMTHRKYNQLPIDGKNDLNWLRASDNFLINFSSLFFSFSRIFRGRNRLGNPGFRISCSCADGGIRQILRGI
jgi:hypothetical protein